MPVRIGVNLPGTLGFFGNFSSLRHLVGSHTLLKVLVEKLKGADNSAFESS